MLVGYFGLTLLHTQKEASDACLEMEVFFRFSTVK